MVHPKPDRSTHTPNRRKILDDDQLDIGWNEGVLRDGRPYRIECWAQEQITSVTIFLSTNGLENHTNRMLADLLEAERIIWWMPDARKSASAMPFTDASGNSMWSINVVVGIDGEPPVAGAVPTRPYGG